jgi:hypothetical protein
VTVFAISTGLAVLAWIGLALGLVLAIVVLALLQSVLRPLLEIRRYSADILAAGVGIAKNLDAVDELARTRELATAVPDFAVAYLNKVQGGGS